MDGHSEREVLETFNKNEKNVIARFLFLNRLPICPIISKWSREISCDLLTQCFTLKC